MKKFFIISLFISFLFVAVNAKLKACTIFTIQKGDKVIVGNNEDFYFRHGRVIFFPASPERKHGMVLFGLSTLDTFAVLGGINDQGLFIDYNALKPTKLNLHPGKKELSGGYIYETLSNFSTVNEVIEWAKSYNLSLLEINQAHVADKTGAAAILGLDRKGNLDITQKTGKHLLSTNFNIAHGRGKCWRYDIAEKMLKQIDQKNNLTHHDAKSVLEAASQGLTLYSTVSDLRNGIIHIYSLRDFRRSAIIDLKKELAKGEHSLDIELLVSQQTGISSHSAPIISLFSFFIIIATLIICAIISIFKFKYESINLSGKFVFVSGLFIFLLIIFNSIFRIPYTFIYHIFTASTVSIAPILIFSAGVMFRPWISFVICSAGSVIGIYLYNLIFGSGQEINFYMITILISQGLQGPVISLLRKRNEILAVFTGATWAIVSSVLLGLVFMFWTFSKINSMMITLTLANVFLTNALMILFIPLSFLLNKGLRIIFKVKYLDELLE